MVFRLHSFGFVFGFSCLTVTDARGQDRLLEDELLKGELLEGELLEGVFHC